MYARALKRSASASRKLSAEFVPFSWTLFVVAVLHFSVWSLGVCCPPAQCYFAAHTSSLKTCNGEPATGGLQQLIEAQQAAAEQERSRQLEIRDRLEKQAAEASGSRANTQAARLQSRGTGFELSTLILLQTLQGVSGSSDAEAAAPAQIQRSTAIAA